MLNGFATLMLPIIWMLSQSTNVVVRLLGGDPKKAGEGMTEEELRDIYEAIAENPSEPLRDIVHAIPYLPATARVIPTLTMMRAEGQQIAVIIDEYGGTDGIVTLEDLEDLEDLVEELVGETFDEYDTDSAALDLASEGGIIDGRLNFQDFQEATGMRLPESSSDTVAGFVIERLGRLATVGDVVTLDGATLQATSLDHRRISELLVTPRDGVVREGGSRQDSSS